MKTSDIPTIPLLELLAKHQGEWAFWDENTLSWPNDVFKNKIEIAPKDFPTKLILSKFKNLIKRGLIGGCECGCRGDFEITDKGLELIGQKRTEQYSGY